MSYRDIEPWLPVALRNSSQGASRSRPCGSDRFRCPYIVAAVSLGSVLTRFAVALAIER